jgi:general secretion pathway protein L
MNFFSIRDGWNWWLIQLASILLPRDPRKEVARLASTELHIAKNAVQIYRGAQITKPLQTSQCISTENSVDHAVLALRKRENVIISLDEAQCFCRKVNLPAGAGTRIQNILDLDVSRITPFARADVINAWYLTDEPTSNAVPIEQIIIRKRSIEDAIASIQRAGAKAVAIVVRKTGAAALPFVAETDGSIYGYKRFTAWVKTATASLITLILGFALLAASGLHRQSLILAAIDDQTAIAETTAVKVRQHVERIETASQEVRALQQFHRQQNSILDVWEELSRMLPDNAWLQSLSFTQESVTAEGLAVSAEDLIPLLESSPLFEKVNFASPVYQDPEEKRAHFSISFQLSKPAPGDPP